MFRLPLAITILFGVSPVLTAAETTRELELVEAARQGDTQRVKQLLAEGVDVNARGRFNITAVWQAASRDHHELLKFLVGQGADVNVPDSVWHATPLMFTRDPESVILLVKSGAKGIEGKLSAAALRGEVALVRAIVESRQLEPKWLAQAIAHAEIGKHSDIIEFLGQVSANPLPQPPSIPEATLSTYQGQYVDNRLNETEVTTRDGRLFIKHEAQPEMPLVAIDQSTFAFGETQYQFELQDGKVVALSRNDVFSRRRYAPRSVVLTDDDSQRTAATEKDDPRVLARDRWPSFRGIEARGLAADQNLPDHWDVEKHVNVRWRTPIAGLSNSCPVTWDDKVFITTAISEAEQDDLRIGLYGSIAAVDDQSKHSWRLLCLDKQTGEILWERIAHEGIPPVKRHLKSTQANSTPATDGQHVVALFNSGGLYCYGFDGQLLWSKHLGVLDSGAFHDRDYQWGFGSSPIIYRDTVIVQCDLQQDSFIAAYDVNTGSEIWKRERDEVPSWGTPTVYESPHGPLLLTNATNFARAYDALSGRERWRLSGNAALTVPTPQVAHELVFITSGYRPIQPIFAARLDARGDITLGSDEQTNSGIAWNVQRGGPYLPTPLVYGGYLYTCGNNGILTCFNAKTGKQVYRKRAARGSALSFTASPVAADGRIYLTAESGDVLVVNAGPKFEVLAQNSLGEYCLATPAISGGLLLARTHKHVVAIGRLE